jgi:hypothetical protein
MGENFDWKEIPPLKLSHEHTYQFQTKSVQAFRSSISAAEAPAGLSHFGNDQTKKQPNPERSQLFRVPIRLSLSFGVQKTISFIGS